jgi:acetyltransferase
MTPTGKRRDCALVVGDDWHKRGIGTLLMESLMEAARARGLRRMEGDVLTENVQMLKLCELLGFRIRPAADDPALRLVSKEL